MSWADFADFDMLLQILKMMIFVGGFLLSTIYLLPRGIISFVKWKESKKYNDLTTSINYCAGAVFILAYLLSTLIISCFKSFYN